jgi:hypothetical protein
MKLVLLSAYFRRSTESARGGGIELLKFINVCYYICKGFISNRIGSKARVYESLWH